MMSKDLKSYFSLTKALIFFSMQKEHDWRINSSEAARQAFIDCIWKDPYFGGPVVAAENKEQGRELCAFPNPFIDKLNLYLPSVPDPQSLSEIKITDNAGRMIYSHSSAHLPSYIDIGKTLPPGMYTIYIKAGNESCRKKLLRAIE
jgi:hypothetical protein